MADNTNGVYVRLLESDEAVEAVKKKLSQIEKKAFGDVSLMNFKTYYWWFAGAMLIFLLIEDFYSRKKKDNCVIRSLVILTVCVLPSMVNAQQVEEAIKKANDLYKKQQYEPAKAAYDEVLAKDSTNTIAKFNLANTHIGFPNRTKLLSLLISWWLNMKMQMKKQGPIITKE